MPAVPTRSSLACVLSLLAASLPARAQYGQFGTPQPAVPQPSEPAPGTDAAGVRPGVETSAFSIRSPSATLTGTREFLNVAGLHIRLLFDYGEADAAKDRLLTPTLQGMEASRAFARAPRPNVRRTVELAVLPRVGGFDIFAFGTETEGEERRPNPDLAQLVTELRSIADAERVRRRGYLGQEVYQLGYVQADRALAGLKALGYAVVEFQGADSENAWEKIYRPVEDGDRSRLPLVVKMVDAPKTSLMDPAPPRQAAGAQGMGFGMPAGGYGVPAQTSAVPDIGGTYLHQQTAGEPQQRLLVVYDAADPDSLARLMNVLRDKIDVPARQMVIEALVIEVNTSRLADLAVGLFTANGRIDAATKPQEDGSVPLVLQLDSSAREIARRFGASLRALVQSGDAQVLSNPSVLVLDGRQARIQVGQQVPVVKSTATVSGVVSSVDYFPVGIVLNLRPRASENGQHVTMQVETIVSAVNRGDTGTDAASKVLFAPVVDNRQVQTYVRVADNTPFIIGGLISTTQQKSRGGVPFLSEIPFLGALFGSRSVQDVKKEVIVVITPHVVPRDETSFSYVIPKDSDVFSTFGYQLFRNAYRIRTNDRFDLKFVTESEAVRRLQERARREAAAAPSLGTREPWASLLAGGVPGEEILVRRMLYEIIQRTRFADYIDPSRIIFFEEADLADPVEDRPVKLAVRLADVSGPANALVLDFDTHDRVSEDHPFAQSRARVTVETLPKDGWFARLRSARAPGPDGLPARWAIPISDSDVWGLKPLDVLRGVLMLKRVISLNRSLPLTIRDFQAGRQVLFPTETDLAQSNWVVDREVAQYFYEALLYYPAFEEAFKARSAAIAKQMDSEPRRRSAAEQKGAAAGAETRKDAAPETKPAARPGEAKPAVDAKPAGK